LPDFNGDQGSCASARAFSIPRQAIFEDTASEIRIVSPPQGVPNFFIANAKSASKTHERL
jgi:hypothetical protein